MAVATQQANKTEMSRKSSRVQVLPNDMVIKTCATPIFEMENESSPLKLNKLQQLTVKKDVKRNLYVNTQARTLPAGNIPILIKGLAKSSELRSDLNSDIEEAAFLADQAINDLDMTQEGFDIGPPASDDGGMFDMEETKDKVQVKTYPKPKRGSSLSNVLQVRGLKKTGPKIS